jgi:RNA polymerase sigma-70 factor (ECF subfamily)
MTMRDGSAGVATLTTAMPAAALAMPAELPSFDDVYARHVAFVWRVVRALGVAEASLEDAVQDVFVVVHRRLGEFEGRAAMTTWLFAIARRVALAYRRRGGRTEARAVQIDALDDEPPATTDTFADVTRGEAAAIVAAILDGMTDDQRLVFALVELEQLAVPEVARLLGLKLNTAYSRLRLARHAFQTAARARLP